MTREQQLQWEARLGPFAAAAAILAALLPVVAALYIPLALQSTPKNVTDDAMALDMDPSVFIVGGSIAAISSLVLPGALGYLYRVSKYRRPETPTVTILLVVIGPVLFAVASVLSQIDRIEAAREFLSAGARTEERFRDLLQEPGISYWFGLPASLMMGFALVLVSVNAMRAGILSRFMGILGVIVGVLPVISELLRALVPLGGSGFLQIFWLGALAALFLGKWPGGRGPAWESGEPIPWPSAAQRREEAAGETSAASIPADDPTIEPEAARDEDEPAGDASDPRGGSVHPVSKKRKRKRRR